MTTVSEIKGEIMIRQLDAMCKTKVDWMTTRVQVEDHYRVETQHSFKGADSRALLWLIITLCVWVCECVWSSSLPGLRGAAASCPRCPCVVVRRLPHMSGCVWSVHASRTDLNLNPHPHSTKVPPHPHPTRARIGCIKPAHAQMRGPPKQSLFHRVSQQEVASAL